LVVFVLWELYAKLEEPLVPMYLFRNGSWLAAVIVSGVGASMYYAFAIVWPSMVTVFYAGGHQMYGAWLASFVGLFIVLGEIVGGMCAKQIGKVKYQCIVTLFLGAIFFASVATCTPDTKVRACVLVSFGVFFVGWTESIAITMVTVSLNNQQELGTGSGVAGSIRFLISAISSTVYSVVLSNRLAKEIPAHVVPAVTKAGLPSSSIASFIGGFTTGNFTGIPGVTPNILAVGTRAYELGNADAYRTVFLTTIAFSACAIIASAFLPNVEDRMVSNVATTLHERNNEEVVGKHHSK